MKSNIVLAGVGGQGVVTLGLLISDSALRDGENAIMSELHGLAQRGGSVSVEVRIGKFHSPIIPRGEADIIIGLEPLETLRAMSKASPSTNVIMNTRKQVPLPMTINHQQYPEIGDIISRIEEYARVNAIDATSLAESAGIYKSANSVILGFAIGSGILHLSEESVTMAMQENFRSSSRENLQAFKMGIEAAKSRKEALYQEARV